MAAVAVERLDGLWRVKRVYRTGHTSYSIPFATQAQAQANTRDCEDHRVYIVPATEGHNDGDEEALKRMRR